MFLKLEGIKGLGLGLVFKRIDPHLHYCSRSNRRPNFINCTSRFNFEFSRSLTCSSNLLNSSKDREYLHVSKIPTYHFQKSLPKLPIPELEKSCQRYFNAQLPLLSETEHKEVQRIVKDFQNGEGRELQKELVESDRKNKDSNYVSDVWFDMYLKDRRSVVLTHSPFLTFSDDPRPEYNTQLIKATNMLISSVRMMKTIRDEKLEPEVFHLNAAKSNTETFRTVCRLIPRSFSCYGAYLFKAFPLDMSQYKNLFNSCRIPRSEKDELFTDTNAKHILVMRNGHFYVFDMLDKEGNIIPENEVLSHLKFILENQISPPEFPVSALTTENRDIWTRARIQLINADPRNENKLRIIESAIFVLCLDDDQPKDPNDLSRKFLYGDGINRWFDKSFQLILTKEGTAGVNLEHSWGDGVALLRYIKEVFKDSIHNSLVNPNTTASSTANSDQKVQRLELRLDPYIKETITKAMQRFKEVTSTLDVQHLQYQKLNKKDIKNAKLSPDSVMQLVIQLAHYRMFGKNVGTYESCSTSAFKKGRTETVRPCTIATDAMCKILYCGNKNRQNNLMEGLRHCSTIHNQLTKEAAMGQGFDRHLFCLKKLSEQKGLSLPIFSHHSYSNLNHIILSTSTLTDPSIQFGGFAAVTPNGFGIGYGVEDTFLGFNVTTFPACSAQDFIECCERSLDQILEIIKG